MASLGFLIDRPFFQIPAGASFIVLLSLIVSIIGAISYWFSKWSFPLLVMLLAGFNLLTSTPFFQHGNQAYGLDYTAKAPYNEATLQACYASETLTADIAATTAILDNWKARQREDQRRRPHGRPLGHPPHPNDRGV